MSAKTEDSIRVSDSDTLIELRKDFETKLKELELKLGVSTKTETPVLTSSEHLGNGQDENRSISDRKISFVDYIKGYTAASTLHGLPNITTATQIWLRIFWFLFMAVALGLAVWQSVGIFTEYFSYPVLTLFEMHNGEQTYPQVTICNHNGFMKSKVQKHPRFADHPYFNSSDEKYQHLKRELWSLPEEERVALSHNVTDFLQLYSDDEWTLLPHDVYGNCYTWVPKLVNVYTRIEGIHIYMDPDEIIKQGSDTKSLVFLNEPGIYPLTTTQHSFRIKSGHFVDAELTMEVFERLDGKYGKCQDDEQTYFQETGLVYSQDECRVICFIKRLKDNCGCGVIKNAFPEKYKIAKSFNNLTECTQNRSLDGCFMKYINKINYKECPCKPRCHMKRYTAYFKASILQDRLTHSVCRIWPTKCPLNDTSKWMRSNTAMLRLRFSDLQHKEYKQVPSYPLSRFLSDLGGTVGLYLGASVLTLCELPQLVIGSILFILTHKVARRNI